LPHAQFIDLANAPEETDEELYVLYLASKDREVMGRLYRRHMALVFGVCMKYLREKHSAQDSSMDIFERLLTHEPKEPVRQFKAFLYVITKNHCLMKLRGEKMLHIEISPADMESALYVHPIDVDHAEEKHAALERCLKKLKDLQKECVHQFYLKHKSYLEISRDLKVTLNAVKSHIQNGKRNLKLCIEDQA
jgi:RNA polymerase sigma factor (sigma-70 family)